MRRHKTKQTKTKKGDKLWLFIFKDELPKIHPCFQIAFAPETHLAEG
jgi:hypothetical protein